MNKLLKLTAAGALLSASAAYGQIELTPNLSVTGFLDMSATYTDDNGSKSSTYDLDQMELDFLLSYDQITGQVDIDYQRDDTNELDLEQAFITYDLGEGTSITAGKFLSYLGWETAEPTGLYQYSYAYGDTIPGYHNGVSLDYNADWGSLGIALLDSVYDDDGSLGTGGDIDSLFEGDAYEYGIETKLVLTPAEGWTVFLGYGVDRADTGDALMIDDRKILNLWTSYEFGSSTVAAEYNNFTNGMLDIDQWLVMYSTALNDNDTITVRVSNDDRSDGSEFTKYTGAYIRTINDNLSIITELSSTDIKGADDKVTQAAIEALFTF